MSRTQRLVLLGLAAVVLIVGGVIAASSDDSSPTPTAARTGPATVEVRDAKPVGGVQEIRYKKGDTIDLTVDSDTADEVHFHGYDVHEDVAKGGKARFRFPATIEGRFVVELDGRGEELATVTVEP